MQLVADAVPALIAYVDREGRYQLNNRAYEIWFNHPRSEMLGRHMREVLGDSAWAAIRPHVEAVLAGQVVNYEAEVPYRDGGTRWINATYTPDVNHASEVRGFVAHVTDITRRRRAEQDSRFLAEASATLAALVDLDSTLQKVARLAVPFFADWCTVDMLTEAGTLRRVAVAHLDPSKVTLAHELHERFPADPSTNSGSRIVRTGAAELIPTITDEMLAAGVKDPELLAIIRTLGLQSYMGVPLKVRNKVLGVITFIAAESGRRYAEADLAVAEDLAHRAAVAVENARLYQALREADRRKDEFLATLAHELRNPLAPIRNSLQILKMPRRRAAGVERSRDMMERQVQHLVRLVDDLLDVSRVMRGKIELRKERVELGDHGRPCGRDGPAADRRPGARVDRRPAGRIPPARRRPGAAGPGRRQPADQRRQVHGAGRAHPADGRARRRGRGPAGRGHRHRHRPGHAAPHLRVVRARATAALDRSQGGLGIGLTLVQKPGGDARRRRSRPTARGWARGASSSSGCRSCPEARVVLEGRAAPVTGRRGARGGRCWWWTTTRTAPNASPCCCGCRDTRCGWPTTAWPLSRRPRSARPDLVFLDIGMPGMDGYEVARRLRQQPGLDGVLLAALTGWGQEEDRRRSTEAGFDHHLVKPVEPEQLEVLIAEMP